MEPEQKEMVAPPVVTDLMLVEGAMALARYIADDDLRQNDKSSLLVDVYCAMASAKPGIS